MTEKKIRFSYFPHTGNKPNDEKRQIVKMLYYSGLSMREVAERMGVTFQVTPMRSATSRIDRPE